MHGGDWKSYLEREGKMPLDFSASISPLGLPESVREAVLQALPGADRYPDFQCRELRSALSEYYDVPASRIVCGNGAADLIWRIVACLRPKSALLFSPCFSEYEKALRFNGSEIRFCAETEQLPAKAKEADLTFLCQPNNPTGLLFPQTLLREILNGAGMLALDECYLGFVERAENHSLLDALREHQNLLILNAFTKTFAMAGLRLGFALCGDAGLAERLQNCGQPWPVSSLAQAAGVAALKDREYPKRVLRLLAEERPRMKNALTELGFEVVPGEANFLLFRADRPLQPQGLLLRDCRDFHGLGAGWYRVAVRLPEENNRLIEALKET